MLTPRNLSLTFSAGVIGGLAASLALWFFGAIGLCAHFNVLLKPALTAEWMYPRAVWGGVWGLLFCLPYVQRYFLLRGLLYSLVPSAYQLFVVFPIIQNKGVLGADLGDLTWAFVLAVNAIWGVVTGWWFRLSS